MIRLGRAVERLSVEQYGAFYAAQYRLKRDQFLMQLRYVLDGTQEFDRLIQLARSSHRNMMRCLREARRDQLARGGV